MLSIWLSVGSCIFIFFLTQFSSWVDRGTNQDQTICQRSRRESLAHTGFIRRFALASVSSSCCLCLGLLWHQGFLIQLCQFIRFSHESINICCFLESWLIVQWFQTWLVWIKLLVAVTAEQKIALDKSRLVYLLHALEVSILLKPHHFLTWLVSFGK